MLGFRKTLKIQILDTQPQQKIVAFQSNYLFMLHMAINQRVGDILYEFLGQNFVSGLRRGLIEKT